MEGVYSGPLNSWQPEHFLRTYSLQEIRYSSGYILGDYRKKFKSLLSYWLPAFDLSQVTLTNVTLEPGFQFPGDLDFLYVLKRGEEFGLVGIDGASFRTAASLFLGSDLFSDLSGEFIVEYLARKLFYSVAKCWAPAKEITFFGLSDVGEIDIEGHLELNLEFAKEDGTRQSISVHFGLGPDQLLELDKFLKGENDGHGKSQKSPKTLVRVGIPIDAETSRELGLGQAVFLDQSVNNPVSILLPDGSLVQSRLGQFNQRFAIESLALGGEGDGQGGFIEIAQAEVENLESILTPGFIFLSKTIVSKNVSLIRDNNLVAELGLYVSDDRFVAKR
jgi:hypothetical protein